MAGSTRITAEKAGSDHACRRSGEAPRKSMPQGVLEARQKLAHKTDTRPEFEYELLCIFVKNEFSSAAATPVYAVVVALAMMAWAPYWIVLAWLAVVLTAKAALLALSYHFKNFPRKDVKVHVWRSKLLTAEFFYGASWSAVAMIAIDSADPMPHMFVFAALMVVISMRMMFASAAMPILFAGTLPITMGLILRFALLDEPFYWAMAAMVMGVHIFFIFLMRGLNATVLTMLEYRAEKDLLIAELEQANSLSDEARRRAEQANLAKSRFLATMSHELRTPLNAILGFSEVMSQELMGPHSQAVYKEYSHDIEDSGRHLLHLINEILDLTRIEAGRYDLNEEPLYLSDIAEDCYRLVNLRAQGKSLTIVENYEENLPRLWIDERAIRQICLNLLSNAIKFTPNGGTVTLSVGVNENGEQYICVNDTGPGIPEDELPRVMSSFGQGSLAHETAEGGTGLGLPIVHGLIALHEGTFKLETKLRAGTKVTVTFPLKRVMEAMPPLGVD